MISKFNSKASSIAVVALTAALYFHAAGAQTSASPGAAPMHGMQGKSGMAPAAMAGGMDMKAMMKGNNDKMSSMAMTGNADVDFAMMMRIHHQGAIDMAQAELRDGKDAQMRKMAKDIIAAQKKEIAQLDKFLAKSGHPVEKMSK
ncbi:DUF305 domain-containing protein [Polaromonas sp.]|uniref:DUF305 domain-containing protein n=1 Tax=Polaromonas sp. TaxID=1869339 RepID=UPI003267DE0F